MKILWHSNAPWTSTGYGNQTRINVPRITKMGHQVALSAFYGLEGGILSWNGLPVFPQGYTQYGQDVMGAHGMQFGADIIISLIDAWVMEPDMMPTSRWIPWFPVDSAPLPPPVFKKVNRAFDRIVYSRFAEEMVHNAGLNCRYVPHSVETEVFKPMDMADARQRMGFPQDKFILSMVAANKGLPSRKAFEPQIHAFAELHRKHPDTLLYLHTMAGIGVDQAVNLPEVCEYHGLRVGYYNTPSMAGADVIFADQYSLLLGLPDAYMVTLYNASDVHLLASMGEGFGIPLLEAQACGCPVIVGDWTSMTELCFSGWKIDKADCEPWWTPLAAYQFMPRWEAILARMEAAYTMKGNTEYRSRARDGAVKYDADRVAERYWKPVLAEIEGNL